MEENKRKIEDWLQIITKDLIKKFNPAINFVGFFVAYIKNSFYICFIEI